MAAFAALTDMVARFGERELIELTDRTLSGVMDAALVERALADAQDQIEGYLRGRYALPLASVPPTLVRIACDLARHGLYSERATDEVRARATDAQRLLQDIAAGRVRLGLAAPAAPVGAPEGGATMAVASATPARTWGMLA